MWKAIVWGLIGLLLGVVLGGAAGAIAGTLIGSVAGALPAVSAWQARRCVTRCRGCAVMCTKPKQGLAVRDVAVLAAAAAGVYVLAQFAVVLAVMAGAMVLVVAGLAWGTRQLTDRLSVVHWPSMQAQRPVQRAAVVQADARPALPAPHKAIEAAPVHGTVLTPAEYARIRSAR